MNLDSFLCAKPLFYEEIDVRRFPRIYASIKEQLPLPQIIHLVGTNGKGSTGRFLATALHRAGKKVGHYTSPHILAFNERLWIDGGEISDEALESAHQKLYGILDSQSRDALSYFEYTTLLSLIAFDGCDYIVCEAGLGGEFDATNAFEKVLSIFTPIDFDHAAFLGTTIESIAGTKLRSMTTKGLLGKQPHVETKIIARRIADEKGSLLMCIDEMCRDEIVEMALQIAIKNSLSDYLRDNLELSMVAFEILGYRVESQLFDQNALFGRLSRIAPNVTLDVGHNALAAEAIARSYEGRKVTLIYNTYGDKDYREILSILKPIIESVEIIEVSEGRIVERGLLESVLRELEIPFSVFDALHGDKEYLVFGSFSVAETFLKRINVTSTMV